MVQVFKGVCLYHTQVARAVEHRRLAGQLEKKPVENTNNINMRYDELFQAGMSKQQPGAMCGLLIPFFILSAVLDKKVYLFIQSH